MKYIVLSVLAALTLTACDNKQAEQYKSDALTALQGTLEAAKNTDPANADLNQIVEDVKAKQAEVIQKHAIDAASRGITAADAKLTEANKASTEATTK